MRVAADEYQPNVEIGVAVETSPLEVVTNHQDAIATIFDGQNLKSEVVVAAMGLSTSLAALTRQITTLLNALPMEGSEQESEESQETQDGLLAFKESLNELQGKVEALTPWAQKLNELATANPETAAPKFPSLPKSVLPNPEDEVEETPVFDQEEQDDEQPEEEAHEEQEEETPSLDEMQALLK
jgi:type IV secretory pathway VirB10-like protein